LWDSLSSAGGKKLRSHTVKSNRYSIVMATATSTIQAGPDIPVIDLLGDESSIGRDLIEAAASSGFVYIKNLGRDIPAEVIDNAFALVRALAFTHAGVMSLC
jgi:hypothetical protein